MFSFLNNNKKPIALRFPQIMTFMRNVAKRKTNDFNLLAQKWWRLFEMGVYLIFEFFIGVYLRGAR